MKVIGEGGYMGFGVYERLTRKTLLIYSYHSPHEGDKDRLRGFPQCSQQFCTVLTIPIPAEGYRTDMLGYTLLVLLSIITSATKLLSCLARTQST